MAEYATVLRSLFFVLPSEEAGVLGNYASLREDRLLNLSVTDRRFLDYLIAFKSAHSSPPSNVTVRRWVEGERDPVLTKLLDDAEAVADPVIGANFEDLFEKEVAAQASKALLTVCREAVEIAEGRSTTPQAPKGVEAAVHFLYSNAKVPAPKIDTGIPANMREAAPKLIDEYIFRKNNPLAVYGIGSGFGHIDDSIGGFKRKGLHLHAGFAGHLKTTEMLNMIVHAAVVGRWNELLFTGEMPATELKFTLVCIHSGDPKFQGIGQPISQKRLLRGQLTASEESFYKQVQDDLITNPNYGSIRVVDSSEFTTFGTVMQRTVQENDKEEVDMMWVDYLTRLPVVMDGRSRLTFREAKNELIAEAKRFAMSFDRGRGLAVGSPFQVNREGLKKAKENGGVLDETCLAEYSAAEKEADGVSYIWFGPDCYKTMEPLGGMIKSRWGAITLKPVPIQIHVECRRMWDSVPGTTPIPASPQSGADAAVLA